MQKVILLISISTLFLFSFSVILVMAGTLGDFGGDFMSGGGSDLCADACTNVDCTEMFVDMTCGDPCSTPGYRYDSHIEGQVYYREYEPVVPEAPAIFSYPTKQLLDIRYNYISHNLKGVSLAYLSINDTEDVGIRLAFDHFGEELENRYDTLNIYSGEIFLNPYSEGSFSINPGLGVIGLIGSFGYEIFADLSYSASSVLNFRARLLYASVNRTSLTDFSLGYEFKMEKVGMYIGYRDLKSPSVSIAGVQVGVRIEL